MDVSETFFNELFYIYVYIKDNLSNKTAADNIADKAWKIVHDLEVFPFKYQEFKNGVRKALVGRYNIFYSVNEQLRIVNILHILYQGMDITKIAN